MPPVRILGNHFLVTYFKGFGLKECIVQVPAKFVIVAKDNLNNAVANKEHDFDIIIKHDETDDEIMSTISVSKSTPEIPLTEMIG